MTIPYHYLLLKQALSRESARLQEYGYGKATTEQCAENISNFARSQKGLLIPTDSLLLAWEKSLDNTAIKLSDKEMLDGLSAYLGFKDYSIWKMAQDVKLQKHVVDPRRKWLITIIVGLLVLLGIILIALIFG